MKLLPEVGTGYGKQVMKLLPKVGTVYRNRR